jgi:integrase
VSPRTGAVSWQVKYRTAEGKARSSTFTAKTTAQRFKRQVETAKDAGTLIDPQLAEVTVADWCDRWLAGKANLTPSTRDRYEGAIRAHIRPRWDATKLADLRHEAVQEWLNGIDREPATVRKVHRVLSQALDYAVKAGRLSRNPAKGVSLPRVAHREMRFLTHDQVDELSGAVGEWWRLLVLVLGYTGLRWGEVAALRVSRLDVTRRRIVVSESVTPVKGVMVWGAPKTHERREVPLPRFLAGELEAHVAGKGPGDLVFTGPRGAVLRARVFQRAALTEAAKSVGVPGFHPHEFRHTAASLAIASGADVKVVQQMLGHKSATMTLDLYGHLFPDRLDVVADALESARKDALAARVPKSFPSPGGVGGGLAA